MHRRSTRCSLCCQCMWSPSVSLPSFLPSFLSSPLVPHPSRMWAGHKYFLFTDWITRPPYSSHSFLWILLNSLPSTPAVDPPSSLIPLPPPLPLPRLVRNNQPANIFVSILPVGTPETDGFQVVAFDLCAGTCTLRTYCLPNCPCSIPPPSVLTASLTVRAESSITSTLNIDGSCSLTGCTSDHLPVRLALARTTSTRSPTPHYRDIPEVCASIHLTRAYRTDTIRTSRASRNSPCFFGIICALSSMPFHPPSRTSPLHPLDLLLTRIP